MTCVTTKNGVLWKRGDAVPGAVVDQHVVRDVLARSITPTTFLERKFENDANSVSFQDTYQHGPNNVLRFGINKFSEGLVRNIQTNDKIKIVESKSGSARTIKEPEKLKEVAISSAEKEALKSAIRHLNSGHETVLVDMLERCTDTGSGDFGSVLRDRDTGFLKTHTVVLCNNQTIAGGTLEVLVVDPNNFVFSYHLCRFTDADFPELGRKFSLKTINKSIQIYKAFGAVGPHHTDYRDCGDVGVKIAFAFQEMYRGGNWQTIKSDADLTGSVAIQHISNSTVIDKSLLYNSAKCFIPVRVKQSSDMNLVAKYFKFEQLIDTMHNELTSILPGEKILELRDKRIEKS